MSKEAVNHPSHYNQGAIEVIDALDDWGLNFALGNVIKYVARADHKDNKEEDLNKAAWYLDYEIAKLDNKSLDMIQFIQSILVDALTMGEIDRVEISALAARLANVALNLPPAE